MDYYKQMKDRIAELGVHPALGPYGLGWGIEQNSHELATFLSKMPPMGNRTVLEIGSGHNAGLARFMQHVLGWDVTSVDVRNYGHSHPGIDFIVTEPNRRLKFKQPFAVVIIDGDHSYESVKADYEHYGKLATSVVMFHDIAGWRECEGVAKFWKEISKTQKGNLRKNYHEAIAKDDYRAGIGWVCIKSKS